AAAVDRDRVGAYGVDGLLVGFDLGKYDPAEAEGGVEGAGWEVANYRECGIIVVPFFDIIYGLAHGHDLAVALECEPVDEGISHADLGLHDAVLAEGGVEAAVGVVAHEGEVIEVGGHKVSAVDDLAV